MTEPVYQNCPDCGSGMEVGSIGVESLIFGVQWFQGNEIGRGGDIIKPPNSSGIIYLRGYRCQNCKTVMFKY
ncbi:MAG: PF20097 family protein [Candidatus Heimdallarchaeaceae archaeon]